jgi:CRISPR-associated protein Cas1
MATLYLTEEGSSLHLKENRLQIKKTNDTLKEISIEKIDNIVLMGRCHITSPLATELLEREIPVSWLSNTGKFFGRLEPTTSVNIERQREQFRKSDDEQFSLNLSKSFIIAKIKNCQVVLRRYNRNFNYQEASDNIEELKRYVLKVENAQNVEELLGYEGNASKIYFKSLGMMVRDEFKFKGRTKQPPKDKFNSLLSFGYTLLLYEIYTAISNKGLHPYCSFLHKIRRGHPALCSDLIEEWRPVIVDSLVMNLVQNGSINSEDFLLPDETTGGIYLTREGSKIFINKFETRLKQENSYLTYVDYPLSFRESLQFQVGSLVKAIENNDSSIYRPILIR